MKIALAQMQMLQDMEGNYRMSITNCKIVFAA